MLESGSKGKALNWIARKEKNVKVWIINSNCIQRNMFLT